MVRVSVFLLSGLLSNSVMAASAEFEVLPRVCIADADARCSLQLRVLWQHSQAVCIATSPQLQNAVYCHYGAGSYNWSMVISKNLTVYLLAQSDGTVLAQRQIKLLQPVQQPVQQRRFSWSIL